jgi:uncharacterized membrane protein YhaH (DUF805 family)
MSVVSNHLVLTDVAHAALGCVTNSQGQSICSGPSAGLLASLGIWLFVYLAILVVGFFAMIQVVTKAGYSGWWVLITLIPVVGGLSVIFFAFSTWPVTKEVQMLRSQLAGQRGYGGSRSSAGIRTGPAQPTYGTPASAEPSTSTPDYSSGGQAPLPTFGAFVSEGKVSVVTPPSVTPPSATPATGLPPAGWHPDPESAQGQLRYWDGSIWTDQVHSP